jgi:phenylpyruvate tautomerase
LGKPEKYIAVSYRYNEFLSFRGTFEPAFLLTVVRPPSLPKSSDLHDVPPYTFQTSLDNLTPERNEAYSSDLCKFLETEIGAPGNRGYM